MLLSKEGAGNGKGTKRVGWPEVITTTPLDLHFETADVEFRKQSHSNPNISLIWDGVFVSMWKVSGKVYIFSQ